MRLGGTRECRTKIEAFVRMGPTGLSRLKELLPVLFDSHGVWTMEGQMELLRTCRLVPILSREPWSQVTIALSWEEDSDSSDQPPGPDLTESRPLTRV